MLFFNTIFYVIKPTIYETPVSYLLNVYVSFSDMYVHMYIKYNCLAICTETCNIFRAKLLHDAWNLAYAGDLSFATAFNMTLFMKFERNHIIWNPVFTFIDQIGRRIDMSEVHNKFEASIHHFLNKH